jgi:hypothetical protein
MVGGIRHIIMNLTSKMIKNLSDDKLIRIANILDPHDNWQVGRIDDGDQEIYEVVVDGGDGQYIAIVQFLFGDYGLEPEYMIRHFDADFNETSPTCDEWVLIMEIINE